MVTISDNVTLPGTGAVVASDEQSINSTNVQVQRITSQGSTSIANGQAAPTNTAANIVSSRDTRMWLILSNVGSVDVYIGVATVTTSNGLKMTPGSALTLPTTAAVQGITASGTGAVHYIEGYST